MPDQTQLLQAIECSHLSHFFVSRKRTTPRPLLALKCDLINGIIDFAVFRRYHTSFLRFALSPGTESSVSICMSCSKRNFSGFC